MRFFSRRIQENRKKLSVMLKAMNAGVPQQQQRYNLDSFNRANGIAGRANGTNGVALGANGMRFNGFVWFIISLAVIGLLLFLFRPAIVTSVNAATGESQLDWGKLIIWSLLLALAVLLVLWVTRGIHGLIVD